MTNEEIKEKISIELNISDCALIETYTSDEVKILNVVTGKDCIFGLLDFDIPVAIIGVPFDTLDKAFITIKFESDEKQKEYSFIPILEDELKNRTFIVYPCKKEYVNDPQLKQMEELVMKTRINRMKEIEKQKIKKLDR